MAYSTATCSPRAITLTLTLTLSLTLALALTLTLTQFSAYLNRFDAGLVIYWFGFVDEVAALDPRILVLDHFPEDCTLMRGSGSPTLARRAIASDAEAEALAALGNEQ